MNVPWRGEPPKLYNGELHEAGLALRQPRVELLGWDFRQHDPFVRKGSLVYLDPPYLDGAAFAAYHASGWTARDQIDLVHLCRAWTARGAYVILSHADTYEMRRTVATWWPTATINTIMMRRAINSDGARRGPVPELLVTA
jgi:DNA adenine methylase